MFLATTALSEFWDKDDPILFLGSWCLPYGGNSRWSYPNARVMSSPWNDRERFYEATRYLDSYNEQLLSHLTDYLNGVHRVCFDQRYWRILIGPWLLHYLHASYDRYTHLTEAFGSYPGLSTFVLDPQSFRVPCDTQELVRWVGRDPYNLQLFSQLLHGMGHSFPKLAFHNGWPETEGANSDPKQKRTERAKATAKGILHRLQGLYGQAVGNRWRVALYRSYLPRSTEWAIVCRTGLHAFPFSMRERWLMPLPGPRFDERRTALAQLPNRNEFERIFVRTLPQNFPSLYLEAYPHARTQIQETYPSVPPVLLSATGWHFDEPFKFLAAEAAATGRSRLVALQHGGGYGVFRSGPMELHEYRISDSYAVWGWASPKAQRLKNLPSPQLSALSSRFECLGRSRLKTILFVATTNPKYLYRFDSAPQGSQLEDYFEWQFRFLEAVPDPVRLVLLFRPHKHPFGHRIRERFSKRFPDLRWDTQLHFHRSLEQCRLTVIDHLGTSLYEALAANVPTILFWNPQRWEVREEVEPCMEALRRARILLDSPEEAVAQVAAVYEEPRKWWTQRDTQEARSQFVNRCALLQKDWPECWAKNLEEQAKRP